VRRKPEVFLGDSGGRKVKRGIERERERERDRKEGIVVHAVAPVFWVQV